MIEGNDFGTSDNTASYHLLMRKIVTCTSTLTDTPQSPKLRTFLDIKHFNSDWVF